MSLQSYIVKKIIRITTPRDKNFVVKRIKTDKLCGSFKPAKNVNFEMTEIGGVAAEWAATSSAPEDKVIIYFHGGGYCTGSIISYRHFTSALTAASGIRTLNVEYRLAPENPFPAALEDALSVYNSLLAQGITSDNIILAGDSAGGGLCLAVTMALRDSGKPLPAALTLFSPWTDLTLTAESYKTNASKDPMLFADDLLGLVNAYAKGQDVKNPLISPIFGSFHNFPSVLIHAGTDEILIDDFINTAEKAKSDGVDVTLKIWEGMFHVFTVFHTHTPEGKKSLREASEYIRQHLKL